MFRFALCLALVFALCINFVSYGDEVEYNEMAEETAEAPRETPRGWGFVFFASAAVIALALLLRKKHTLPD